MDTGDLVKGLAPAVVGSAVMSSIFGFTYFPAIVGAALVGGSLLAMMGGNGIDKTLERAFEACRLGVMQKSGTPRMPKQVKKIQKDYGWRFIYTIPAGLCLHDFLTKKFELQTAVNSELDLWEQDGYLHIRALTHRLLKKVQFQPFVSEGTIPIPIGYSRAGLEIADLVDFPHLLVGGTTGAGKSVFLHGLTYTLCHYSNLRLCIIDLKKLEFIYYKDHAWLATTLPHAYTVLASLRNEMFKRMELFKAARVNNIKKYKDPLPYMVLIIDEFAQLWPQKGADSKANYEIKQKCHSYLHDILSLARAVGIHVVVSTQRPDRHILPGQLKANLPATLAFRVRNPKNAEVIDTPMACYIPVEIPGRAIWNYNTDREVQVMMFDPEKYALPEPVTKPNMAPELTVKAGEC